MQRIVDFIQDIYKTKEFIPLHEPRFLGNEKKYLNECIDSTFVSSVGKFVDEFERQFAKKVGSKFAIATVNGTSALHVALLVANVKEGTEVITQALSFVATSNAIAYAGAKPIFVDVDKDTMGMSPESLENFLETYCEMTKGYCVNKGTKKVIQACVPMHTFGHPCKIDLIKKICDKWNITLIEDSAESLGSYYKKKHTGTFGSLGVFSFNGNKIITAGGGGVIVTDSQVLAKRIKHLTTTAKLAHKWEYIHDELAYNYRMPNLNAALLLAQLEQLDNFIVSKRELALAYEMFFHSYKDIQFVKEPENTDSNYWLQAIILKDKKDRDTYLNFLNERGIMVRPIWRLMSELEMYKNAQRASLENSQELADRVINISSSVVA